MAPKTETKEELKQKAERIWNCYNAMALDFILFGNYANKATIDFMYLEQAETHLAQIEEAIRRYRKGLPQSFEEQPED